MNNRQQEFYNFIIDNQISCFDSFEKDLSSLDNNDQKGRLFEEYSRALFLSNLYNASNVWRPEELPITISNKLNTPRKDKGVDFIAEINGKYYAIQCKFRSITIDVISWSQLGTFFSSAYMGIFNGTFLITNTIRVGKEIDPKKVNLILRDMLCDNKLFELVLKSRKITLLTDTESLRACQVDAIKKFNEYFSDENNLRGRIQMACGTGKTRVAYELSKTYNKIVILVPSLYLLSQFYVKFKYNDNINKIAKHYLLMGTEIDASNSTGYILTTDENEIAQSIMKNEQIIIICTYQSQNILHKVLTKKRGKNIDLMIFDEAHKTAGGDDSKSFALFLKTNEELKVCIKRRLFLTATERLIKNSEGDEELYSMDNEAKYGKQIYNYPMGKAITDGILVDYRVIFPLVDGKVKEDILQQKYIGLKTGDLLKEYPADLLMCAIMIKKMFDENEIRNLLTYHSSINFANKFAELLRYLGLNNAAALHGEHSIKLRNNTIEEFRKNGGVICSVRVFNEGVDIPFCDSVCFVNGRESKIDIIQCIGRCLRLYNGKKIATIILPVIIDDKKEVINDNDYIFQIIRAISDNDFRVYDEIKNRGKSKGCGRLVFKDYTYSKTESITIDMNELCNEIELQVLGRLDMIMRLSWNQWFQILVNYRKSENRLPYDKEVHIGYSIGNWCMNQRQDKRIGKLSDEKIKILESLDIWVWEVYNDLWKKHYNAVIEYSEKFGMIPKDRCKYNGLSLGQWCQDQRKRRSKNKVSEERLKLLESIKYWAWDVIDAKWISHYNTLFKYYTENNELPGHHIKYDGFCIGSWCVDQINKKNKGKLKQCLIDKLEKIPIWSWDDRNAIDVNWEKNYKILLKFIEENNRIPITKDKYNGLNIGLWCYSQRVSNNKGILKKERYDLLNKISVWYW